MEGINKIVIIGGPGTGKTTLAHKLGEKLNLPVYHIDGIHHLEDWKVRDKEERDRIILEKIENEKWIFDGTYRTTLDKRVKNSDLTIFLDYSNMARLKGALGRFIKNHGKEKKEIPGCKEQLNIKFLKIVWNWKRDKRAFVVEILEKYKDKNILVFKKRTRLNKWYNTIFGESIQ